MSLSILGGWSFTGSTERVAAEGEDSLIDSDGDFLPDAIEWAVLTSPTNPDTDADLIPDFVEVVQRGSPRQPNTPLPIDNEMRVVVTGPSLGCQDPAELHLLFRFFGTAVALNSLQTWVEVSAFPGLQIPLSVYSFGSPEIRTRQTANDGLWVIVSVPMASEAILRSLLPCSIGATADLGGRVVHAGVRLVDIGGVTSSLVSFGDGRWVFQSIGQQPITNLGSNRVCVLTLESAGSGPGGSLYQIVDADCEDCNELECGPSCQQSIGWVIPVPGGTQNL
ncbi:MAG: hypothetical protein U1E73_02080 [Planctomycetota bacterium]